MSTTSRWAIPYPEEPDAADVPLWMNEAATVLDGVAMDAQGTLATRPAAGHYGQWFYATDTGQLFRDNGTSWTEVATVAGAVPAGTVLSTARATAPSGYLLCDGSPVSRTQYAALYAAIGTAYGAGDGTTTFNVPDLRGRSAIGAGTAAGDTTATAKTLGAKGGAEKVALTVTELPSHVHPDDIAYAAGGAHIHSFTTGLAGQHAHNFTTNPNTPVLSPNVLPFSSSGWQKGLIPQLDSGGNWPIVVADIGATVGPTSGNHSHTGATDPTPSHLHTGQTDSGGSHSHARSGGVQAAGGGATHDNLGPYAVVNFMIKT